MTSPPNTAQQSAVIAPNTYTKDDFTSDQIVRWCPGCGDYSILAQMQKIMPSICERHNLPREKVVFLSGIGCSSRFPYYMNTYGFHGIHGRAPTFATGLKVTRPDLQVWVVTGDGDGLSIGGNHLLHALRRNIDIKILLFDNRIYGLTKGQYSPTSEFGKRTKSSPMGTAEQPINPLLIALAAEATFVARSLDRDPKHLTYVLERAAAHRGSAFVQIYQNCNIFNDGAFDSFSDPKDRDDKTILLEHGKPVVFGKGRDKGLKFRGSEPEVVQLGNGVGVEDLIVHDERASGCLPYYLAKLGEPEYPVPLGVFRAVERPTYETILESQVEEARKRPGAGDLMRLIQSGDTWEVD
jgi:2-oxoglutarate ferredoxin oxidoreductase subunit beta